MACSSCSPNISSINYTINTAPCPSCSCTCGTCSCSSSCSPCGDETTYDSANVKYTGAELTCIDVESGTSLESILQTIDTKICEFAGIDWSSFSIADCILNPDDSPVTSAQEFAEAIALYVCSLNGTVENFITNVYNTFVTNITQQIDDNNLAGVNTECTDILSTDTIPEAILKIDGAICELQTSTRMDNLEWEDCFTVGDVPTTVAEAVVKLLSYICTVKAMVPASVTIPTFDNTGTCLPGTLTTTDSLATTIAKIKEFICDLDVPGDVTLLSYGCVTPATTLAELLQNIIDKISTYSALNFDPTYFTTSLTDPMDACGGIDVTINPAGLDNKVASNASDVAPSHLMDKLTPGSGISLDDTTTPGTIIISSTASDDKKVKVNSSDASADYLDAKIDGDDDGTGAITMVAVADGGNTKVVVSPAIDWGILSAQVLIAIQNDVTLLNTFCAMACDCNCNGIGQVSMSIYSDGNSQQDVSMSQNTPTLAFYVASLTMLSAATVTTGNYTLTTAVANPQMTIVIKNTDSVSHDYDIYVEDNLGNPVSGSTSVTQTIAAGATYTNSTFSLGISTSSYVVKVDIT